MAIFIASVYMLLFYSTIYFTQAGNDSCNRATAANGLLDCVKSPDYNSYQWAICATKQRLNEIHKIRDSNINCAGNQFCWYTCMSMTVGHDRGNVWNSCKCDSNTSNKRSNNMKCYIPNKNYCDWYKECLKSDSCNSSSYRRVLSFGNHQCKLSGFCLQHKLYHLLLSQNLTCNDHQKVALKAFKECFQENKFRSNNFTDDIYIFWTTKILLDTVNNSSRSNVHRSYLMQKQMLLTIKINDKKFSAVANKVANILEWTKRDIIWDWNRTPPKYVNTVGLSIVFIPRSNIDLTASKKVNMDSELNLVEKMKENGFKDLGIMQIIIPTQNGRRTLTSNELGIQFKLFTKSNNDTEQLLDPDYCNGASYYKRQMKTVFIIHGFQSANEKWIPAMKTALLKEEDINVVVVNWSKGSERWVNEYDIAVNDTATVGFVTGVLIECLNTTYGTPLEKIHIIGHSLGAHIAGYAGAYMYNRVGKIGRISGLDPAGPYFQGNSNSNRLDQTDATFVDVIHTNMNNNSMETLLDFGEAAFRRGYEGVIGNIDFYPNGGRKQPGCGYKLFTSPGCSHERVNLLYIESITPGCEFISCKCDEKEYEDEKCTENCISMGYRTDVTATGVYYLDTNAKTPFCTGKKPGQSRKKRNSTRRKYPLSP